MYLLLICGVALTAISVFATASNALYFDLSTSPTLKFEMLSTGFNAHGIINKKTTETYAFEVMDSGNGRVTSRMSTNTSGLDMSGRFYLKSASREVYFSENETYLPLHLTELFLDSDLDKMSFNSSGHELATIQQGRELSFTFFRDETLTFQGTSIAAKTYNSRGNSITKPDASTATSIHSITPMTPQPDSCRRLPAPSSCTMTPPGN